MSHFRVIFRRGGVIFKDYTVKNTATAEGLFDFMQTSIPADGGPAIGSTDYFVGLYSSGLITVGSTGGSPGFTEFLGFSGLDRPLRSTIGVPRIAPELDFEGNPITDGHAVLRSQSFSFSIITPGSIKGVFWCTEQVKANGLGTLWGGADLPSPVSVKADDTITTFYTITAEASDSIGAP